MIKVMIVDDQAVLRESLKYIIEQDKEISVVCCARNGREAFELYEKYKPDVILMDIVMPVCDGIESTRLIKEKYKTPKIIILTTFEDEENISNALKNRADGYILKDVEPEALRLSIKSVVKDMPVMHKTVFNTVYRQYNAIHLDRERSANAQLKEKEIKIVQLIVEGKSNKEIASLVLLSEGRVRNIISMIFDKLKVADRTQLAVYAVQNKLV
jgi:DNA-binding NarL/FixJ family response regulator